MPTFSGAASGTASARTRTCSGAAASSGTWSAATHTSAGVSISASCAARRSAGAASLSIGRISSPSSPRSSARRSKVFGTTISAWRSKAMSITGTAPGRPAILSRTAATAAASRVSPRPSFAPIEAERSTSTTTLRTEPAGGETTSRASTAVAPAMTSSVRSSESRRFSRRSHADS